MKGERPDNCEYCQANVICERMPSLFVISLSRTRNLDLCAFSSTLEDFIPHIDSFPLMNFSMMHTSMTVLLSSTSLSNDYLSLWNGNNLCVMLALLSVSGFAQLLCWDVVWWIASDETEPRYVWKTGLSVALTFWVRNASNIFRLMPVDLDSRRIVLRSVMVKLMNSRYIRLFVEAISSSTGRQIRQSFSCHDQS